MFRHLLRATVATIVLSGSLFCFPSSAKAQGLGAGGDITSDPFTFYYAFYLPNQQLQSMRPRPIDTLNQAVANRQYYAQMDRRALYNPISALGDQSYDPLHPYSGQNQERIARPYRFSQDPSNIDGTGPSLYYGRAANFFPGLRAGRGPNANVTNRGRSSALGRPRALSGGGGGGGGMGGGMGGMM
jgi:hypothetical protein